MDLCVCVRTRVSCRDMLTQPLYVFIQNAAHNRFFMKKFGQFKKKQYFCGRFRTLKL